MPGSKRALVTGGTGTVGRAVARRLIDAGWDVAILTRQRQPAPIAGAAFCTGDLGDAASLRAAVSARDLVVHCALSATGVDIRAAGQLTDAAIGAGVQRFIHISTMSVYPVVPSGTIDESCGYVAANSRDIYAVTKSHIERAVLSRADRLHIGVLQPANVVSPDTGWWSAGVVQLMRQGRFILVNGGTGIANLVHVDDVAASVELAASADYASGSRFLIADGHPIPWAPYLRHLESLAGGNALKEMTADEAKRYSRDAISASAPARVMRRLARALTRDKPVLPMDDIAIDRFASTAVVSIEHARRVLVFSPAKTRWPAAMPAASPPTMP